MDASLMKKFGVVLLLALFLGGCGADGSETDAPGVPEEEQSPEEQSPEEPSPKEPSPEEPSPEEPSPEEPSPEEPSPEEPGIDDSDADGVEDSVDAYPMDPAASLDSDGDGFPDEWNEGYTNSLIDTELSLDPFPHNPECFLIEQIDVSGECYDASTMPAFTPTSFFSGNDFIYIYSASRKAVYRWSVTWNQYVAPVYLDDAAEAITYSEAHHRIYLSYGDNQIHFIDLTDNAGQYEFTQTTAAVSGLVAAGNYVLAHDSSGAWGSHYIFDVTGYRTDYKEWRQFSSVYSWNSELSRLYHFQDGFSPNDLLYEDINQATGLITASGDSPYHGDYSIQAPIVVSDDGRLVLLGSGDLYDAESLTWEGSVGSFGFAVWTSDNELLTTEQSAGAFKIFRRNDEFRVVEVATLPGILLDIISINGKTIVVRNVSNSILIS